MRDYHDRFEEFLWQNTDDPRAVDVLARHYHYKCLGALHSERCEQR